MRIDERLEGDLRLPAMIEIVPTVTIVENAFAASLSNSSDYAYLRLESSGGAMVHSNSRASAMTKKWP